MQTSEIKFCLDLGFEALRKGDFSVAVQSFKKIVDNCSTTNAYAANRAMQCIRWYCLPLEAVFKYLESVNGPVDVKEVMANYLQGERQYNQQELEAITANAQNEMAKMPTCIRVGQDTWIYQSYFEELSKQFVRELLTNENVITFGGFIQTVWSESAFNQESSLNPFLKNAFHVRLIRYSDQLLVFSEAAISRIAFTKKAHLLAHRIRDVGKPVKINEITSQIFSVSKSELVAEIWRALRLTFNDLFLEVSDNQVFLSESLQLETRDFSSIFATTLTPLTTQDLILRILFPGEVPTPLLSSTFLDYANSNLSKNANVCKLPSSYWLPKRDQAQILQRILSALAENNQPINTWDLLRKVLDLSIKRVAWFDDLAELLEKDLQTSQEIVQVSPHTWLSMLGMEKLVEQAYTWLFHQSTPQSTRSILNNCLPNIQSYSNAFFNEFSQKLLNNAQFLRLTSESNAIWKAIDPRMRDIEIVYQTLNQHQKPLTEQEIRHVLLVEHGISDPSFVLSDDPRFTKFAELSWALSGWSWINDLAFEYSFAQTKPQYERTIVGFVCQQHGLDPKKVFFTPETDSRFVQHTHNRWGCRYLLTCSDLDLLEQHLASRGGIGTSLENLFKRVIRIKPEQTNALEKLANDYRFIELDGQWYAHSTAYYHLSSVDVERVYEFLAGQPDSNPILLKDLITLVLGRDGRLTDAAQLLHQDDRFIEVHPNFWALQGFQIPTFDRTSGPIVGVVAGRGHGQEQITVQDVEIPTSLTRRKKRTANNATTLAPGQCIHITLRHIDILHGNLRVRSDLRRFLPPEGTTVQFIDDLGASFIGYLDETRSILNIRDWLVSRKLTFGDKLTIQPRHHDNALLIAPRGDRDELVYQEALQHQDIERLIEEARLVNKSFHDLMIEVMESIGAPLHREDIFQLVDYQRTASRNTIFEILSLTECPYEELRYFVPVQRGYWTFDRKRKEAYDMKMNELIEENTALRGKTILLEDKVDFLTGKAQELSIPNTTLQAEVNQLKQEKLNLQCEITELGQSLRLLTSENRSLAQQFEDLGHQVEESCQTLDSLKIYNDRLQADLTQNESELIRRNLVIEDLQRQLGEADAANQQLELNAYTSFASLQSETQTLRENLSLLQQQSSESQANLREILTRHAAEESAWQSKIGSFQREITTAQESSKAEIAQLQSNLEAARQLHFAAQDQVHQDQEHIIVLRTELEGVTARIGQIQVDHQTQVSRLLEELEAARQGETDSKNCLVALATELEQERQSLQALQEEHTLIQENSQSSIAILQAEVEDLTQQNATMHFELHGYRQALNTTLGRLFARWIKLSI